MKKILLVILNNAFSLFCFSQKENNVWMLGIDNTSIKYGIDFNSGNADTFSLIRPMNLERTNAGISDSTGQLLFYTNGIYIANKNHDSLLNTQGFNPGYATTVWQSTYLSIPQACLIFKAPGSDSLYYIFHESGEDIAVPHTSQPVNLRYSVIDMSLDAGMGGLIPNLKNTIIINDTLIWGRVAACKHANGRDYWVVVHRCYTNLFYKILITPDTIIVNSQSIGLPNNVNVLPNYYGQAVFSSDGSKYALEIIDSTIQLYDFDRCSGMLSNPVTINIADTNAQGMIYAVIGSAFSANSRFLYISNNGNIRQYDTWAGNVLASEQIVALWDTFYAPGGGATTFFMLQLAPDSRIYVSQSVGNTILHYIEFPDSAGVACHVVQDSFITPVPNTIAFPNIVNYDLGSVVGSACDTVLNVHVFNTARDDLNIRISPNPTRENFWVTYNLPANKNTVLEIYDALGNKVQQHVLYGTSKGLLVHTDKLSAGVYFYKVKAGEEIFSSGKIAIIK